MRQAQPCSPFRLFVLQLAFLLTLTPARSQPAHNPGESQNYARSNSFGISIAYSPDSSHILLGVAEKRKLLDFSLSYGRRVYSSPNVNWAYEAAFSPLSFVGDPRTREIITETTPALDVVVYDSVPRVGCTPVQTSYSSKDLKGVTHSGTIDTFCHGRQWTIGQTLAPIGMRWNFRPGRKLQPTFSAHVGYMYSSRPVPVPRAGGFNFTFDVGSGMELYRDRSRSLRLEYRYHHISNHDSAIENPGIDNGLIQLSCVFGR